MRMRWLLAVAMVVGFTTRLLWLDILPQGVHEDEIAFTYNAYSLATTGKDEWGIAPWQALFSSGDTNLYSFGASKMLLYSYALVPITALLGLDHVPARVFSAVSGLLTALPLYFLLKALIRDSRLPLANYIPSVAVLLFLASPLHITLSRRAIDPAFSLLVMVTTLWLFFRSFSSKSWVTAVVLAIALPLQVIAYYPTKFFLLLYLPTVSILFYVFHKKVSTLLMAVTFLFITIFIGFQLTHDNAKVSQNSALSPYQLQGVISDLNERLGACKQVLPEMVCKLGYNKPVTYTTLLLKNYVAHFSSSFLFTHGVDVFDTSFIRERGILYLFEVVFLILGLTQLPKLSPFNRILVLAWLLIFPIPDSLSGSGTPRRLLAGLPVLSLLSALGAVAFYNAAARHLHSRLARALPVLFCILVLASAGKFMLDYYWYSLKAGKYFRTAEGHAFKQLIATEPQFQHVYVTDNIPLAYLYYTYYKKIPPENFQVTARRVSTADAAGEWMKVDKVGTALFAQTQHTLPTNLPPKTLILATPNDTWLPEQHPSLIKLKRFVDTNGEIEQELWAN